MFFFTLTGWIVKYKLFPTSFWNLLYLKIIRISTRLKTFIQKKIYWFTFHMQVLRKGMNALNCSFETANKSFNILIPKVCRDMWYKIFKKGYKNILFKCYTQWKQGWRKWKKWRSIMLIWSLIKKKRRKETITELIASCGVERHRTVLLSVNTIN